MTLDSFAVELYGCRAALSDLDALSALLHAAAARVGATVLTETKAAFQPHGATVVLVLAESHMILATWPEHNYAMLDLLLCSAEMDAKAAITVVTEGLCPNSIRESRSPRTIGPAPAESA